MKRTRKVVRNFKKEYGIKGSPSLYTLKKIIEKFGFIPCGYHADKEKLYETKTYDISTKKSAFAFEKGRAKYVFYDDLLNEKDVVRVLAHEIGHLYYNHLYRHESAFDTEINKEWEANIFALYLMKPK